MHVWDQSTELLASSMIGYTVERLTLPKDPLWGARSADELAGELRGALSPLPADGWEFAEWGRARVSLDYHIEVHGFLYSVPHALVGKRLYLIGVNGQVIPDNDRVEHQVATRQTESDDESVIVMGPDGDPLFESTRSSSKSFLIARELDRRL